MSESASAIGSMVDVEKFKEALLADKERQLKAIRLETENTISSLIVDKRLSVEKKIAGLRKEQKYRYKRLIKREEEALDHLMLTQVERLANELMEELEKRVFFYLEKTVSDRDNYPEILNGLISEGLGKVEGPVSVMVAQGEAQMVQPSDRIEKFQEAGSDHFGGCKIFSSDGEKVIDNTFLTRWKQLKPEYLRRLSVKIIEKSLQIPGFLR